MNDLDWLDPILESLDAVEHRWDEAKAEAKRQIQAQLQERDQAAEDKTHALYRHMEKLRHAVRVDHYSSSCGNCLYNKLTGTETNCPRCMWGFQYVYTQYMGEEELAHKVFPHLELISWLPAPNLPAQAGGDKQ